MEGKEDPPDLRGIIPNTFDYIFSVIARESEPRLLLWSALLCSALPLMRQRVNMLDHHSLGRWLQGVPCPCIISGDLQ